ncbi:MAG TPA: cytochrome c [Caulobacteraceae bacterium]|nr:cytochrome c [Caulobacteraceae bacterium]
MQSKLRPVTAFAAAAALVACAPGGQSQVERGKYLVSVIGCSDCHTPGGLSPKPDLTRFLGGSDLGFSLPGLGYFVPPNLTPDKATGLGSWTADQIVAAVTAGVAPDGRMLAPAMPVSDFKNLSKSDAYAIAAYLKSLPPVSRKVPGPGAAKPCGAAAECLVPW